MTFDFTAARQNMLDSQVRTNDVPDLLIQDAMATAPRDRFCSSGKAFAAYADAEVEYAPGYSLLKPRDVAKLLHALSPKPGETALCIAAPYAAMVLATMGLTVTLRQPAGAAREVAKQALVSFDVTFDDSDLGAAIAGRHNVIIVEGAVPLAPATWLDSLAKAGGEGDRLGVIERKGPVGKARIYLRTAAGAVGVREVFDATPPVLPGFEPTPAFTF